MSERWDVAVLGAGHNGLAAAASLGGRGLRVLVLERREVVGGLAAGEEFHPGFRSTGVLPDTGAVRPWVIESLELRRHGLRLRNEATPVLLAAREGEGRGLLLWRTAERLADELAGLAASGDAAAYAGYRAFLARIAPVLRRVFDGPPLALAPAGISDILPISRVLLALRRLGKRDMMEVLRIGPMCAADWLREWFEDDRLRAGLAAPALWATFTGPSSPGTNLNLLLHECLCFGEVEGGGAALVAALERSARARRVEIRTGAPVRDLVVEGRGDSARVTGVVLEGGERITARAVAAACDPKHLFLDLLSPVQRRRSLEEHIAQVRVRGTTAKLELALSRLPSWRCRPELAAERVRIGSSLDALERAFDSVKYRRFSERPLLEIVVPTIADPALAPAGQHVLEALVHFVPYQLEGGFTAVRREELYSRIIEQLEDHAPGLASSILGWRLLVPADLEARYGTSGGHLHHGEHAIDQLLVRPSPECARYSTPYRGLYLCGSGSHPGGGLTCAPGAFAAKTVLSDLGS